MIVGSRLAVATVAVALATVLVTAASAANIVGTAANDTLRGTAKADKLDGKGGNDKLYGLGGNDILLGGPGADLLSGGPGADSIRCGPGIDTVIVDAADKVAADCERLQGAEKLAAVSVDDASTTEGNGGTSTLSFRVSVAGSPLRPVSVRYATADGTAAAPSDYTPASGTVTLSAAHRTASVDVSVVGDSTVEADETVRLVLSGVAGAGLQRSQADGTIRNDDSTTVSIADASIDEGDTATRTLAFSVTLTNPSALVVSASVASADGTATAPGDYVSASGTVAFAPGEVQRDVSVTINGDIVVELDEAFTVTLANPAGAVLGRATATGTIRNDDRPRARRGRYSGTTSQGRPLSFTVSDDGLSLRDLQLALDLTCPGIGTVSNLPFDLIGETFAIPPDLAVRINDRFEDADLAASFAFAAALSTSGPASGTLRLDLRIKDLPGGPVDCSSGTVSWNAA